MEHWTPSKLLEYICTRPRMFAENGDFRQLAAFLDGYSAASCALAFERGEQSDWAEWAGFRAWLADRCWEADGFARNLIWDAYVRHLYPEEQERLEHLPKLFAEYLAWRGGGGDPSTFESKWVA